MARFIEYNTGAEDAVFFEVEEIKLPGAGPVGIQETFSKASKNLKEMLTPLGGILQDLKETITDKIHSPEKITVEFGAKLGGEVGVIVSKSQAEAHFKISLTWTHTTQATQDKSDGGETKIS